MPRISRTGGASLIGSSNEQRADRLAGPLDLPARLSPYGTGLSFPDFMSASACLILSSSPAGTGLRLRIGDTPMPALVAPLMKLLGCLPFALNRFIPSRTAV